MINFFLPALIGALAYVATSMVGRVLLALGMGYFTFTGVSTLGDWIMDAMKGALGGLPVDAAAFLAFLWVDKGITMIFSAWVVALSFKLGGSDSITALLIKRPS